MRFRRSRCPRGTEGRPNAALRQLEARPASGRIHRRTRSGFKCSMSGRKEAQAVARGSRIGLQCALGVMVPIECIGRAFDPAAVPIQRFKRTLHVRALFGEYPASQKAGGPGPLVHALHAFPPRCCQGLHRPAGFEWALILLTRHSVPCATLRQRYRPLPGELFQASLQCVTACVSFAPVAWVLCPYHWDEYNSSRLCKFFSNGQRDVASALDQREVFTANFARNRQPSPGCIPRGKTFGQRPQGRDLATCYMNMPLPPPTGSAGDCPRWGEGSGGSVALGRGHLRWSRRWRGVELFGFHGLWQYTGFALAGVQPVPIMPGWNHDYPAVFFTGLLKSAYGLMCARIDGRHGIRANRAAVPLYFLPYARQAERQSVRARNAPVLGKA